ncbi:MAG: YqgE/AlgH family protein [Sphingobium sp.]
MDNPRFYAGQFLLALPGMDDIRFERSVIALCAHDENGAFGVAVDSVIDGLGLHGLLASVGIEAGDVKDRPVLYGGPVEPRRGFVLHSPDWGGQDTIHAGAGWALSGSLDMLRAIAAGGGPSNYLVALGYAGWAPGQLEQEMTGDGWFLAPARTDILFDVPPARKWSAAFASCGVDASHLVNGAGTA